MVTPTYYPPPDGRRYSHRMASYPLYPERRASAFPVRPESRTTMLSEKDGVEEVTPQRKRIAVACGRCRKRKIRCSGDNGNGPCTNCKNAGYEPCQFLRVASQETMMKTHDFAYNLEASRQYHSRGSTVVPPLPTVPQYTEGVAIPSDALAYRQGSGSFAHNNKPYYPVAGWAQAIPEEHPVNYPMYGSPSFHGLPDPDYNINYRIGSAPPPKPSSALYVDNEPNYTYSSGPPTTGLAHRPAAGTDSNYTFQNVAAGMAGAANGSERVLPIPVGRSLPSSGASPSYRNDSTSSTYSKGSISSGSGTSPNTPNSDVPSSYTNTNYEPSSMPSYPPHTLSTQLKTEPYSTQLKTEPYSTPGPSDNAFPTTDSLRPSISAADLQYRYTDTTTRRDSTSAVGAMPLNHGPTYVSQVHSHPAPYMLSGDVGSGGGVEPTATEDSHHKPTGTLRT